MPPSDDGTLFDIPSSYRPKRKADPPLMKWAKYKGRFTCDLCIMNIHDGISDTPLSKSKWSLSTGTRKWFLCAVHSEQIRNGSRRLSG